MRSSGDAFRCPGEVMDIRPMNRWAWLILLGVLLVGIADGQISSSQPGQTGYATKAIPVSRRPLPFARHTLRQMWELQRELPRIPHSRIEPDEDTHEKTGPAVSPLAAADTSAMSTATP